jgi:hypothetical protein
METSNENSCPACRHLDIYFCRTIKANGTIYECKCSCLEDRGDWDYYELKCGHKAHTRCLRHWLAAKGRLNCPICGDMEEINKNRWCWTCNEWGHQNSDACTEREHSRGFYDKVHKSLYNGSLAELKVMFDASDGEILQIDSGAWKDSSCQVMSAALLTLQELRDMKVKVKNTRRAPSRQL